MSFALKSISVIYVILVAFQSSADSLKIAVLPDPVASHIIFMKAVSQILIERGHQVSIIVAEDNLSMVGDIPAITFQTSETFKGVNGSQGKDGFLQIMSTIYSMQKTYCHSTLQNNTLIQLLKSVDIMVTDSIYICSFMLSQIANKRNIMIGIQGTLLSPIPYPAYPSHPAYIPQIGTTFNSNMNFFQRVRNTIAACIKEVIVFNVINYLAYTIKHEYNIRPDLGYYELMQTQEVTLVAGDFAVDYARPMPPNMILIGSLSSLPASMLPEDLEKLMQSSGDDGVILVSMGTIYELTDSVIPTLLSGFQKVKQKIIWKTRLNIENASDNVQVVKWMPQNDILGHKNLKAFITHGGSKGIYEAAYHGVPLIGIPIQAEQELNIAKANATGVAITLDKDNLTPDTIAQAITEIVTNSRYKGNALQISKLMQSRPITPRQLLVQWVEYVANNSNVRHLKPVEFGMPWYQYYLIDVIAFMSFCIYGTYNTSKYLLSWSYYKYNKIKAD